MTSNFPERGIATNQPQVRTAYEYVENHIRQANYKFTDALYSRPLLDRIQQYINSMSEFSSLLKNDIHNFFSKLNFRFQIDLDALVHLSFGLYRIIKYESLSDLMMTITYVGYNFFKDKFESLKPTICVLCSNFVEHIKHMKPKVMAEGGMPDVNFKVKEFFELVVDNKLARAFRELILNLVGLKFFSREISSSFIKTLGSPRPVSLIEFAGNILSTVDEFITFAVGYSHSGSFIKALAQTDPIIKYLEDTYILTVEAKNVYLGEYANMRVLNEKRTKDLDEEQKENCKFEPARIPAKTMLRKLRKAIIEGETISKTHKVTNPFKNRLLALKLALNEINGSIQSKNRTAPIGIAVFGNPAIGKSSILPFIYKCRAKYDKLEFSSDLVYNVPIYAEYWEGFDNNTQPYLRYGEMGSVHKNMAKKFRRC